jgi:hypothetical protein
MRIPHYFDDTWSGLISSQRGVELVIKLQDLGLMKFPLGLSDRFALTCHIYAHGGLPILENIICNKNAGNRGSKVGR